MINKMIVQTKQIKIKIMAIEYNDNQPSSPSNVINDHSTVPSNTQPANQKTQIQIKIIFSRWWQ